MDLTSIFESANQTNSTTWENLVSIKKGIEKSILVYSSSSLFFRFPRIDFISPVCFFSAILFSLDVLVGLVGFLGTSGKSSRDISS